MRSLLSFVVVLMVLTGAFVTGCGDGQEMSPFLISDLTISSSKPFQEDSAPLEVYPGEAVFSIT